MQPLTKNEFQDAVQKGLGRAVIHVRSYGYQDVQDDILYACLHNLAYHPQIEGDRSRYLMSLIEPAKDDSLFREPILEKVAKELNDDWDEYQLLTLTRQFAQRGDEQARKILYAKFDQQPTSDPWTAAEQIIELDGLEGLLYIVERLGARLINEPEFVEDDWLLRAAYEQFGKETVLYALAEKAESNPSVKHYLDAALNPENDRIYRLPRQPVELTLEEILVDIKQAGAAEGPLLISKSDTAKGPFRLSRYAYSRFGQKASDKEIEALFARFLAETRRDQLIRYLWLFSGREVPRLDNRLFELATSTDVALQQAAIVALATTQDRRVREFALHHLEKEPRLACQGAVALLVQNYQPGDSKVIESVLDSCDDIDDIHGLSRDLLTLAEAQPYPELTACLYWVYESTPCSCSHCRKRAVEILIEWDMASESLLSECLWDACDETCDLAKEVLATKVT